MQQNIRFTVLVVLIVVLGGFLSACSEMTDKTPSPIKVEIAQTDAGYQLIRDGEPYHIKGAGMGVDKVKAFAAHGGNSIRNWTVTNEHVDIQDLLDSAQANGVTVALCLSMKAEHWGFDYNDNDAVADQLESFREHVIRYRDHPALLFWIIGNELNHGYSNPKVYDAVNEVSRMIHELDPNHPTTTTISGADKDVVFEVSTRAQDLDFISFQVFGGLFGLPETLADQGFTAPFMVTEWGATGYWEVEKTSWGAPVEMTSSGKASVFLRGHEEKLTTLKGQLIGSYAFLWGQKQERTPTWFGMLTEAGEETEAVDVMHYIWNGTWPANRSPRVNSLLLDGKSAEQSVSLSQGQIYKATLDISDLENDPLNYRWEVKVESDASQVGGDFEESILNLDGLLSDSTSATVTITAPNPGAYRLFAYAYDDYGHAAHANIPFIVKKGAIQMPDHLIAGEVMAVAYSGFREGQHPDRGDGAINPRKEEILEDLELLVAHNFKLIRLYDSGENSRATLEQIREHDLPIKVLLGTWLKAELSNHAGCSWLDEPIPKAKLMANTVINVAELQRGIKLAKEFADIVVAVNVGNEALVDWNDHMVSVEQVIAYVRSVKQAIDQPVTVADNYEWWIRDGSRLAAEVDFLGVHTYALWEDKSIDEALAYTIENIERVHEALPDKPIAILEAGWASIASEFGDRASEASQARYYAELNDWATRANMTVFFFEAFDEPWKGDVDKPLGAEKHWGLFNVDRTPKRTARQINSDN
jgi:exo-beta-1,3-glucanase (GH17 family)